MTSESAPLALITNDDGIDSPGLHALAVAALEHGFRVVVAAPASEASGSGAAITGTEADGRIPVTARSLPGLDGVPAYAVRAAPALIALIAAHGAFGEAPDYVLSGINRGANIGHAIIHSGTVGAALTGGTNGARGLAVSLDVGLDLDLAPEDHHWERAAAVARAVLPLLAEEREGTVFNVNVPNEGADAPARLSQASLAPFGIVHTTTTEQHGDEPLRLAVAELPEDPLPGSDAALLAEGYATVTSISGVHEVSAPSLAELSSVLQH